MNQAEGINFELNGEKGPKTVVVSDKMNVADAEYIAEHYPGVYVEVVEIEDKPGKPGKAE
ncbi:hypothetical protein FAES_3750 [Fibrella aestuarina BUZ 2]|uniref:Uncharacterized protein n=1 Tax=Fibrella aestuarina BUZ 2 TaxID=1166018 RepID=I0KCA4_9BACT|nr:hypothetical protein [Fibrella aestuarina]CCH01757.1 hypothetical protein FAES_3750 [Fibrella aestuarina BUZ 2]